MGRGRKKGKKGEGGKKRSHRAQIRRSGNVSPGRTLRTFEAALSTAAPDPLCSPPLLPSLCTENEASCCRLTAEHCCARLPEAHLPREKGASPNRDGIQTGMSTPATAANREDPRGRLSVPLPSSGARSPRPSWFCPLSLVYLLLWPFSLGGGGMGAAESQPAEAGISPPEPQMRKQSHTPGQNHRVHNPGGPYSFP